MSSTVGAGPRGVRLPEREGVVERDGVRVAWAQYGTSGPDVVLLPSWSIVPARFWKGQVATLARSFRVTTFDGRGSGASDRPQGAAAYSDDEYVADTLAVMDAAGVARGVLVGLSCAVAWSLRLAARYPERASGIFAIGASCGLDVPQPEREEHLWQLAHGRYEGWGMYNQHFWLDGGPEGYDAFLEFFFGRMFSEPHSTKQFEDAAGWAHEIDGRVLADTVAGRLGLDGATCPPLVPLCEQVRCPVYVLHGAEDRVRAVAIAERLAELTGGTLDLVEGGGHGLPMRHPVLVNEKIRAFVASLSGGDAAALVPPSVIEPATIEPASRRSGRDPRVLFLSSPIGLGHAWRDVAIADALRVLRPQARIDWLTQDPVTRVLGTRGERVHPASACLAGETDHFERECLDHDLHAFQALRRMDEIMVNNAMVCFDVLAQERYDLVIADEAWDVDHFLHENPRLKRTAYAWLTDFVGYLPMPDGGPAEAALTSDYNAEMIGHRARYPGLRDLSLFVGNPDDVVDQPFGPGLPGIREWTEQEYAFSGYVGAPAPPDAAARAALRRDLGYGDEPVCLVSVGGSGAGTALLQGVIDAVPALRRRIPGLRVVAVAGPRIDPRSVRVGGRAAGGTPGLEVHGFLPGLTRHLAACDVAIVQGGLSTCMELTALRRPFVYVPLRNHFEQNLHVRHRLNQYGAGHCLQYEQARDPDALAEAVAGVLAAPVGHRPVETDGAQRAARLLADLL